MIYPRPFIPPTVINDSLKARAKAKREALVILREMVRYFGLKEVKELLADIAKAQRGNKTDKPLDALLVAQYDAAIAKNPSVTRTEVATLSASGSCTASLRQPLSTTLLTIMTTGR
jgi:hypothetical protein